MLRKSYLFAVIFFIAIAMNYSAIAQPTVSFESITDAFAYTGDNNAVIKVIITGEIEGERLTSDSEWYKFRSLNEAFPNIEEVEILTSQDLPDALGPYVLSNGLDVVELSLFPNQMRDGWLKRFSAPNVKRIGKDAFLCCASLESVNFPAATIIEQSAFAGCNKLTSVNIPLATTIESHAFLECSSLISVDFPMVTSIKFNAFRECIRLTSANIPLATTIEYSAFRGCSNLVSADFPLVTSIGEYAFMLCPSLVSINFPVVTKIGTFAFYFGGGLNTISLGTGFTTDTKIEFVEDGVFEHTQKTELILGDHVLPTPNMIEMRWKGANEYYDEYLDPTSKYWGYPWKSVNGQLPGKTTDIPEAANIQLTISPNPTSSSATLGFNLKEASNLNVILVDINSNEIMQLHNNFEQSGLFTKTFSIANLPVGIYFVKIALNEKNVKMEKIVKY